MRFIVIVLSFFLITCGGGGGGGPTEPEGPTYVVNLTSLSGNAQKGPFNNGTAINIAELTNALSPTGRNFSTAITDNTGRFSVANVQLESPYVELRANGYYFNEVSNQISSGQLTLFALSNLSGKTSLNVNILTHLEKNRMGILMSGTTPLTFAQAKLQAQEEVFAIFDYSRANVPESELLDISQGGAANGKLLAMSAIIQGDLSVGQMSELLANMSTDIASDGTLDDATLRNTLIDNSKNLDLAQIRANLEARYASLGISATIPDFETEVNQFLKPPVAQDINASTNEDVAINITLAGSDPEGEALTYTILEVNNATVTLNNDVANYLPDANFNGTDTFTYYANDGTSDSNIGTVTMTVNAEDDDPNTQNVSATTDEDVAVVVQLAAEEYDGDSYSFAIVDDPTNGSVSLDGTTVTYTPNQDFNGTDTFTFEATDDTGRFMNVGTATITINPINDAPVLVTTSVTESVNEEASVDITITATDVDGDQLTFDWNNNDWSGGSDVEVQGDITINGNIFTFAANPNTELAEGVTTTGQFYYLAQDSEYNSDVGLATVTITGVDDLPHADDKNVFTPQNTSLDILLSSTDPDGGDNSGIQYEVTESPSNGVVSLNGTTVTYTPTTDFHGSDSFKYKVSGDTTIATVSITVNEVIGTVQLYPDLTSDYSELFSDIVYNESTGGYLVNGVTHHKGDTSNGGGTWKMFHLETDAVLNSTTYQHVEVSQQGNSGGTEWAVSASVHGINMTERSIGGGYLLTRNNDYFWSFASGGSVTYTQMTGQIDNTYNWIDYVKTSHQTSDGGYLIFGAISKQGDSQDKYPIIAKIDASLNLQYYKVLDNHVTDSSLKHGAIVQGMVQVDDSSNSDYYLVAKTYRPGISDTNAIQFYKVRDDGSNLSVLQHVDLSSIANSPTDFTTSDDNDTMGYLPGDSNTDSEFVIVTDNNELTRYNIDSSGSAQIKGTFDLNGYRNANYMEIVSGNNYIYIVAQTDEGSGTPNIKVAQLSDNLSVLWEKTIDIAGVGYEDRLGGATSTQFGSNSTGIAITGSTRKDSSSDWNGFILLLDDTGNRIY